MGCPALEVMRAQMEDAIRGLGAEPDVRVVLDDSWSTDRISAEGREKLRAAGFAPPAPRGAAAPTLVQLERGTFRCPWCGSADDATRERLRPDPVPVAPLLRRLPPAVRAVQDDLTAPLPWGTVQACASRSSTARSETATTVGPRVSRPCCSERATRPPRSRARRASTTSSRTGRSCSRSSSEGRFPEDDEILALIAPGD